jgi:hypothetical protein
MAHQIPVRKTNNRHIGALNENEKALLSLILMNNGKIKGTKLKRIYLEKYSLWDLQNTQDKLLEKGMLVKSEGKIENEFLQYSIPDKLHDVLKPKLTFTLEYPKIDQPLNQNPNSCCDEYSILWYLIAADSILDTGMVQSKKKKINRLNSRRLEELWGLNERNIPLILNLIKILIKEEFFQKNEIKKWSDIIKSPSSVIKNIFRMVYYDLRDSSKLGREDVGMDNVDFLIDEISSLSEGDWFSLDVFLDNAKNTLFTANQPNQWIHFNEDAIWNILNNEFRLVEVVKTAEDGGKKRYFSPTVLGEFCFDVISEDEFLEKLSERNGKALVHPNFEITLVSREIDPKNVLELLMFSSIVKVDTMSVFKLSRESIALGNKRGISTSRMVEFLRENSKEGIPQNVEYSILDWGN